MSPCGKMLCGVNDKTNIMRHMHGSIPYLFVYWASLVFSIY